MSVRSPSKAQAQDILQGHDPVEEAREQLRALGSNVDSMQTKLTGSAYQVEELKRKTAMKQQELITSVTALTKEQARRERKDLSHEALRAMETEDALRAGCQRLLRERLPGLAIGDMERTMKKIERMSPRSGGRRSKGWGRKLKG